MPSGADLEYARLLAEANVNQANAQGLDAARLEQINDEKAVDLQNLVQNGRLSDIELDFTYLERALRGQLFTTRNAAPVYGTQIMAVNMTSRMRFIPYSRPGVVRLVYAHWTTGSAGDGTPSASVTFKASIEANDFIIPLTFNGQRTATIVEGLLYSDPIVIDSGVTEIFVRTFVDAASLTTPRANAYAVGSNGEGREAGDHTAVAAISADVIDAFNTYIWGPTALVSNAVPNYNYRSLAIAGDSIAYGQGDSPVADGVGFLVRAAERDFIPYIMCARAGEVVNQVTGINYRHRGPLLSLASHVITNHSRNDITSGNNLSLVQSNLIKFWRRTRSSGPKVFQTTVTPRTNSTDAWVTTTNQTIASSSEETVRVNLNNWLRDGAVVNSSTFAALPVGSTGLRAGQLGHPLSSVIEITDAVETSRNSGIWKANYTADGLHPNSTAHAAMAAAVPSLSMLLV